MKNDDRYIVEYQGQRWPGVGPLPKVGEVIAGFVVHAVDPAVIHVGMPQTPKESRAYAKWERSRQAR